MDKVHNAINLLECVDILQVNVKEDTEVVHSGHGSSYVKNEEIEETNASNNAKDPIQAINNRSESDEEDCQPPAHTGGGTFSERKRKNSAASDALTTPKTKSRKKRKAHKDKSTQQSETVFDQWCNQLFRFKEECGHCDIPQKYADNPSLGQWCSTMRSAYKKIQKGMKTKSNLSQDRIQRLQKIGFHFQVVDYDEAFEKRAVVS